MVDSPIWFDQQPMSDTPYMPTLQQLRQMMHSQPDLSHERMAEIRRKLESGSYLTRSAAEETAGRMIDDGEFPRTA